jgi:hypothetical protein
MIRFDRTTFSQGGVRYEQRCDWGGGIPGAFTFSSTCLEDLATPFFELWSLPGLSSFVGLEAVTIIDLVNADAIPPTSSTGGAPIVRINCSVGHPAPTCGIDGLTLIAVEGGVHPHAVEVVRGRAKSVTIFGAHWGGSVGVVDSAGLPAGNAMVRSEGGLLLVTDSEFLRKYNGSAAAMHGGATHALLVGQSGEPSARLGVGADGSMHWGDGQASEFQTVLRPPLSASVDWDPPALAAGVVATLQVAIPALAGATQTAGALCGATHEAAGVAYLVSAGGVPVLTCFVVDSGSVLAVLKNEGSKELDLGMGKLRVLLTPFD